MRERESGDREGEGGRERERERERERKGEREKLLHISDFDDLLSSLFINDLYPIHTT